MCGVCGEDEGVAEALGMQSTTRDRICALAEVVLHARVGAGRSTPRERRGDEHAHALGSVAVDALADGMSIVPTRRADRAGASSMKLIESDSISVSDAARGDKTSAGKVQEEDHVPTRPRWCSLWLPWRRLTGRSRRRCTRS